eukprot:CAMPEP_0184694422 /NCGR_PEP_ID=MMETSP0313-20130426/2392_1 /TAXON_ID=2792 /ORGANISM="Porphyridium aerugineum, Strain SAG 1380-2" /LENGTH=340 /DNA_ID=CAMNT_0027152715 /DNA_START=95 /DNA_END=1117 /DNA_ORIENTATION=+
MSSIKVLTEEEALERLRAKNHLVSEHSPIYAFYSSHLDGILTSSSSNFNRHLMSVPMDDHGWLRGHAVFDTAIVYEHKIYQLDQHLERFMKSATGAMIEFEKSGFTRERLKEIITQVIKVGVQESQLPNLSIRYYLTAGIGGFGISARECIYGASFYCIATGIKFLKEEHPGISIISSVIPMKPKLFANIKTTNYLPNAMSVMDAENKGSWQSLWIDTEGNVGEMATCNVGFMINGKLVVPSFENILAGISIIRIMHLAKTHLNIQVEHRKVSVEEAKSKATEMFVIGGSYLTIPILQWDDTVIGSGKPGPYAKIFKEAQLRDLHDAFGDSGHLVPLSSI